MTPAHPVVVLGGGYAGLAAARKLRKLSPRLPLLLIDRRAHFFERIRLHQAAAGAPAERWSYAEVLGAQQVDFLEASVERLDVQGRRLVLHDGRALSWSQLVYAPGSHAPPVEGAERLDSPDDGARLAQRLAARPSRLVVVGAGLTGLELAAEVAERFASCAVTLVTGGALAASRLPGGFSAAAVAAIEAALGGLGVELCPARAVAVRDEGVELTDGRLLSCDLCVWTGGFVVPSLAREAGLAVTAQGQVLTDPFLRSVSHPQVVAVGDAASVAVRQAHARMGCATALAMAMTGARTVARLAVGQAPARPFSFSYLFRNVSLGRSRGVVQFVDPDDRPLPLVWTGPRALEWKEFIMHGTLATCGLARPQRAPRLPPLSFVPQLVRAMSQYE